MFDDMPGLAVSERPPADCPGGHAYVGGAVIIGWEPCGCTVGHTGHRTYWCLRCGHVLEVPPCVRVGIGTSEALGIGRPNWARPDPEKRENATEPGQ
jgi:hypothetical protein